MPQEDRENTYKNDARLVARCLDGDRNAWTELVDRNRRLIYSVPIRLGLRPDEADEVFQEVCIKLLTRLETLRDGRSLVRWLVVTAQRTSFDLARKAGRTPFSDESVLDSALDTAPRGDELVLETERAHLVRLALDKLNKTCQELIEGLYYTEPPLSYVELGRRLGKPHGSLGPTRMRCLKTLRKHLGELGLD